MLPITVFIVNDGNVHARDHIRYGQGFLLFV